MAEAAHLQAEKLEGIVEALEDGEDLDHVHEQAQKSLPHYMLLLVDPYHLTAYWYEVVECVRKIAMVGLPVVIYSRGGIDQLLMGQLFALVFLGVFLLMRPLHDPGDNVLHAACDVQLYLTMLMMSVLKAYPVGSGEVHAMDVCMMVMTFATASLLFIEETGKAAPTLEPPRPEPSACRVLFAPKRRPLLRSRELSYH